MNDNATSEFIDNVLAGDMSASEDSLNGLMASKLNAALDQKRDDAAKDMFGQFGEAK